MDDQGNRKPSVFDRANSAINTARNIRSAVQNLRRAIQIARTVATAARTAAAAVATSEVWIPVVIIIVIILIVLFTVIILMGGKGAGGFDSQSSQGGGGPIGGGEGNTNAMVSCPVANGSISTPSYQADPTNGHCGDNYPKTDSPCTVPYSRRALSIDVPNSSQAVLPMIEGKAVKWAFVNQIDMQVGDCSNPGPNGCGKEFVFVNYLDGGKNWTLFIGHIGFTSMMMGQTYDSGAIVGGSAIEHFHFSIGKDISNPTSFPAGSSDTRPGWLAADVDAGMCIPPPVNGGGYCSVGTGYCSVSYLQNFFGDPTVANKMSIICNRESGGDPNGFNDSCLRSGGTLDYSGGLFQINLLAHTISDRQGNFLDCPTAFKSSSTGDLVRSNSDLPCIIVDDTLANRCKTALLDPDANIGKAVELYNDSGFSPWAAAGACNVQ